MFFLWTILAPKLSGDLSRSHSKAPQVWPKWPLPKSAHVGTLPESLSIARKKGVFALQCAHLIAPNWPLGCCCALKACWPNTPLARNTRAPRTSTDRTGPLEQQLTTSRAPNFPVHKARSQTTPQTTPRLCVARAGALARCTMETHLRWQARNPLQAATASSVLTWSIGSSRIQRGNSLLLSTCLPSPLFPSHSLPLSPLSAFRAGGGQKNRKI